MRQEAAAYKAIAPETLRGLYDAVAARVGEVAARFWTLGNKGGEDQAPQVVPGWLPPNVAGAERFPWIIVRPRTGTDDPQGGTQSAAATIDLLLGVYSDTDDGWLELVELLDALRLDLHGAPTIGAYEHTGPLSWEIPEEQPRPQWLARVTTIWTVPRPRRIEARNPPTNPDEEC